MQVIFIYLFTNSIIFNWVHFPPPKDCYRLHSVAGDKHTFSCGIWKFTVPLKRKLATAQTRKSKQPSALKPNSKHSRARSSSLNWGSLKTLWHWSGMFSTHVTSVCFVRSERDALEETTTLAPLPHDLRLLGPALFSSSSSIASSAYSDGALCSAAQ